MYNVDRRSQEFMDGMHSLLCAAKANKRDGFMCCPCAVCKNMVEYPCSRTLHSHLFKSGFMPNYICWTKHGETGVVIEEVKKNNGTTMILFPMVRASMILQWEKLKKRLKVR